MDMFLLQKKEKILLGFASKKINILVATPVIEVGIDIPNASIIVIESAQRFGLAQLHQLRGRVGRGEQQSYCIAIYDEDISETGQARLRAFQQNQD